MTVLRNAIKEVKSNIHLDHFPFYTTYPCTEYRL